MSLEPVALVQRRGKAAPIWRVRCSGCKRVYRRVGWPADLRRSGGCASCAARVRMQAYLYLLRDLTKDLGAVLEAGTPAGQIDAAIRILKRREAILAGWGQP